MADASLCATIFPDNEEIKKFWCKVSTEFHENGCMEWTGAPSDGYGNFSSRFFGRSVRAHRYSWFLKHGSLPIWDPHAPVGILHRCDNRLCVNPQHLFIGTQMENMHDMIAKGRHRPHGKWRNLGKYTCVQDRN